MTSKNKLRGELVTVFFFIPLLSWSQIMIGVDPVADSQQIANNAMLTTSLGTLKKKEAIATKIDLCIAAEITQQNKLLDKTIPHELDVNDYLNIDNKAIERFELRMRHATQLVARADVLVRNELGVERLLNATANLKIKIADTRKMFYDGVRGTGKAKRRNNAQRMTMVNIAFDETDNIMVEANNIMNIVSTVRKRTGGE